MSPASFPKRQIRGVSAGSDPCTKPPHRTTLADLTRITEDAMPDEIHRADLFEIIRTTRSMRRLKSDPVPNELIRKILEAGVCAPSGGNMQRWRFLVIRDPKIKETVGALYKRAWDEQWPHGIGLASLLLAPAGRGLRECWWRRNIWPTTSPTLPFGSSPASKARHL